MEQENYDGSIKGAEDTPTSKLSADLQEEAVSLIPLLTPSQDKPTYHWLKGLVTNLNEANVKAEITQFSQDNWNQSDFPHKYVVPTSLGDLTQNYIFGTDNELDLVAGEYKIAQVELAKVNFIP